MKEKRQAKRAAKLNQEFQEQDRGQDGDQDQRQGSDTSTEDCAASPEPVIMLHLARVGFGTKVSTLWLPWCRPRCSYARAVQVHWTTNSRVFCSSRRKSLRAKRRRRCPQIKDKRWYRYLVTWPIMRQASRDQQPCVPQQHATECLQNHPSTQLPADYPG